MAANGLQPPYFLSQHAYACVCGDKIIFLDLASGEYLAQRIAAGRPLDAWLQSEPQQLRQLLEAGLLTQDPAHGRSDTGQISATAGLASFADRPPTRPVRTRAGHVFRFLLAATSVVVAKRYLSLKHIVAYVRRRKATRRSGAVDVEQTCELIAIFNSLYPWLFGNRDECFRNSLMLLQFLAFHDVFPDWIFAVRAEPFAAHCWLQQETLVLNDNFIITAALTPIMVV